MLRGMENGVEFTEGQWVFGKCRKVTGMQLKLGLLPLTPTVDQLQLWYLHKSVAHKSMSKCKSESN